MTDTDALRRQALRTTLRPAPHMPPWVGTCLVVLDLHGAFSRVPGCLTAAVYAVPGRRPPGQLATEELWVVAVHRHPTDARRRVWTTGLVDG